MICNVGKTDKMIRFAIGGAIGIWGILTQNWLGLVAIIPIGTAVLGFCPLYMPVNFSSCKTDDSK